MVVLETVAVATLASPELALMAVKASGLVSAVAASRKVENRLCNCPMPESWVCNLFAVACSV